MSLDEKVLRVVKLDHCDSYFNTALDESILRLTEKNISLPSIIFTKWEPTVSIGRTQDLEKDVDLEAAKKYGAVALRRRSGGQAVYLDEDYIVFSLIAPREYFLEEWSKLRKSICVIVSGALNKYGVPCQFYEPDNIIIKEKNYVKTLGNSGQIIGSKAFVVHCSVRFDLANYDKMIDMLMINGIKLNSYANDIKKHLGYIRFYNNAGKNEIVKSIISNISFYFNSKIVEEDFSDFELANINKLAVSYKENSWNYHSVVKKSRGICYFFVNGKNIVPVLESILPYNKPSGLSEALLNV